MNVRVIIILIVIGVAAYGLFFIQLALTKPGAPAPTPTPIANTSGNIIVTSPHLNDPIPQEFEVTGKARIGGNFLNIKVSNPLTGKIYFNGRLKAAAASNDYAGFAVKVSLQENDTYRSSLVSHDKLKLEVFQTKPDGSSPSDTVQIPLIFSPALP